MITPQQRHRHSGKLGDGEKIKARDVFGLSDLVGGNYFIGKDSIDSIGDKVITGVGFKPKLIIIFSALNSDTKRGLSWGFGSEESIPFGYCTHLEETATGDKGGTTNTNKIMRVDVYDGVSAVESTYADLKSYDSDGFTLDVDKADLTLNFIYLCIG